MTFISNTYQREFDHIVQDIYTEAADHLVSKIIGQPRIPMLALSLHFLFLREWQYSSVQIRDYCTSTTLVQMGLNMHSEVSVDGEPSHHDNSRLRQMQVLAGDLYSGKFYQILAHRGDMRVIHFLSEAICYINQAKTNLYDLLNKHPLSVKLYVQEVEKICSGLLNAWLQNEQTSQSKKWHNLVCWLLTAERIMHDLHHATFVTGRTRLVAQLKQKAQLLVTESRQLLHNWGCHETKRELEHLIDVHFPGIGALGKAVEEC